MKRPSHHTLLAPARAFAVLVLALLAVSVAELCLGPQRYTLPQLWVALARRDAADPVWRVLAYVRLPRLVAGLCAGSALAVAGSLLQAVLNNAMASPNVIGVNAGAGFSALLAGAAVSFAGLLSFVGLLAPHITRRLVGTDHRVLLPASALLGAICVVGCDLPSRLLFAPFELPVGILLSLIGGPFFLGLLLRHKGGRVYA